MDSVAGHIFAGWTEVRFLSFLDEISSLMKAKSGDVRMDFSYPDSDGMFVGMGDTSGSKKIGHDVVVGIRGLSYSDEVDGARVKLVYPRRAVEVFVAQCHEYVHCMRDIRGFSDKEQALSQLSVQGSEIYYRENWRLFPHEVDAERYGVSGAWDLLYLYSKRLNIARSDIDRAMLEYVNDRAHSNGYMFSLGKKDNFKIREEVDFAFMKAYENSRFAARNPRSSLVESGDLIAHVLCTTDGKVKLRYAHFVQCLLENGGGSDMDGKVAALVLHVFPDKIKDYPELMGEDLSVRVQFHKRFPESTDKVRKRLGIPDSVKKKSKSVVYDRDLAMREAFGSIVADDDQKDGSVVVLE